MSNYIEQVHQSPLLQMPARSLIFSGRHLQTLAENTEFIPLLSMLSVWGQDCFQLLLFVTQKSMLLEGMGERLLLFRDEHLCY